MLKGVFLILFIVIGLLATIVSLIITVVKKDDRQSKRNGYTIFSICLTFTFSLFIYASYKITKKMNQATKEIKNIREKKLLIDNREYLISENDSNEQIVLLQSWAPDSLKSRIPATFYTHFGSTDYKRYPLVFPYSLNCVQGTDYAELYNEKDVIDISFSHYGATQTEVSHIVNFAFDNKMLLAEISDPTATTNYNGDMVNYIIFIFENQAIEEFETEEAMISKAKEKGFTQNIYLIPMTEYNALF